MTVQPARIPLVYLLAAMRSDWDRAIIQRELAAVEHAGWPFARIAVEAVTLAAIDDSDIADLRHRWRPPVDRPRPGNYQAGLDAAKAALHAARHHRATPQEDTNA